MSHPGHLKPAYFLARHVYAARVESVVILLDSKLDDYILIESHLATNFVALLSDGAALHHHRSRSDEFQSLVEELCDRSLITSDLCCGKPLEFLDMIANGLEIPGPRIDALPKIRLHDITAMAAAVIRAFFLLKIRDIHAAIQYVRKLQTRGLSHRSSARDPSELVEIYHRVRPIFYSSKDQCLFNSLVLIIFLAKHSIYPSWCFGVKINPFLAHCWVEDEQWLYNDQYMRTYRYTPIMRI